MESKRNWVLDEPKWWEKAVFQFEVTITRNDIIFAALFIILGIAYFNLNWDWVMGRR